MIGANASFNVLNNRKPSEQYFVSAVPDYINVTYKCIIFTDFVEQNNKLVEAVQYASDSYWGDPSRFQFRAMIDSFAIKTELADKEERTVSSTFNIKLNGYIIPDVIQKDMTTLKKIPDVVKVIVEEQVVNNINNINEQ